MRFVATQKTSNQIVSRDKEVKIVLFTRDACFQRFYTQDTHKTDKFPAEEILDISAGFTGHGRG